MNSGMSNLPILQKIAIVSIAACAISIGASARIPRNSEVLREFQRQTPCPATQSIAGPCPGWQIDHIEPLCAGGADRVENLQWLTVQEHKWKTRTDVRVCRSLGKLPS